MIGFVVLLAIGAVIYSLRKNYNKKKKTRLTFNTQQDFTPTETYISGTSGVSIAYDASRQKVCLVLDNHKIIFYYYRDILQSELEVDGETVSKKSVTGTIGRALLGGLIGGGIGAVVGGVTGKTTNKEK